MKTLFMETTRIEPSQTVGEIQKILGEYGASAIRTDYDHGEVVAVSFTINLNGDQIPFRLPCRWEAIKKLKGTLNGSTFDSVSGSYKLENVKERERFCTTLVRPPANR